MNFIDEFIKGLTHGATLALCAYTLYTLWRVEDKIDQLLEKGKQDGE